MRRALLTLCVLTPSLLAVAPVGSASASAAPQRGDVQVRIDDVSPSVVARSTQRRPLQVRVTLTNTTDATLTGVTVSGVRGEPIGNQNQLDDSIADTTPPNDGIEIPTAKPLRVNLPAGGAVTVTFTSTISILDDGRGICQCIDSVYPIYLRASAVDDVGATTVLGSATTYVPSQRDPVTAPVKVSWVWPLLDRPHRLADDTVFIDDDLATSVSGGRLDRALQVIERLRPTIPVTLVVDPDLLDELEVMAGGKYTVRTADGKAVAGTGQVAARAWLERFAAVLRPDRAVQVSLTPYADPDIQTLARERLTWSTDLPTQMRQRVTAALVGRSQTADVAWPAGGIVSRKALDAMAASGVRTVVMNGAALSPSTSDGIPVAVARLRSSNGSVTAAATSPVMQRQVAQAVEAEPAGATGANVLPYLVAEVVVRAIQGGSAPGQAVLAPPRYVDPSPERAVRAIEDTSSSAFTTPAAVRALSSERPGRASSLRTSTPTSPGIPLPAANVSAAEDTAESLPAISSLLSRPADAQPLVAGLALAMQRVTSSAWRPVPGSPLQTSLGPDLARDLASRVDRLLGGVRIVTPSSGSYTLGSKDSKLPITVENTLPYPVVINLDVVAQGRVPGYTMLPIKPPRVAANSKQTVQVPSRLDRSGSIPVVAQLTTPTGRPLGTSVLLYVRSTAFGTIGLVITFVAGGVLALALIVRVTRRLQRLRRLRGKSARDAEDDEPGDQAASTPTSGVGTAAT